MKKLVVFALLFLVSHSLYAQTSPNIISYQGLLRSSSPGSQIAGNRLLTVTIYSDAEGTVKLWQSTMTTLIDSSGVFNCLLGTPDNPLPNSAAMDRPMWIGIALDHNSEMRPLSQLTSSPYALNVADSSITSSKMKMNYVSSISVNGQPITGHGTNLNIVAGDGLNLTWVPNEESLVLTGNGGTENNKTLSVLYWQLAGNASVPPPSNFLGTTDSTAFEIHVNNNGDTTDGNRRVMRYEPMPTSANLIGGFRTNAVILGSVGGVIGGGGGLLYPNIVKGNFGVVGGGAGNTAYLDATVAGGSGDTAHDDASIGGGQDNTAEEDAAIAGGELNIAGEYSSIGGGAENFTGTYASIEGGEGNDAYGSESSIGGGYYNTTGNNSSIPGGYMLSLDSNSFGFSASDASGVGDTVTVPGVSFFSNTGLWLANTDNQARSMRFYAPNSGHKSFPLDGQLYSSFQAGGQTGNIVYTLPLAVPDSVGWVLGASTIAGTSVQLAWQSSGEGGGGWLLTGNAGTTPPTNYLGTNDTAAFEIHVDNSGTSTGGNHRVMRYMLGSASPDILAGSSANMLGSGLSGAAILAGGSSASPDSVLANFTSLSGGDSNLIATDAHYSFMGGGHANVIDSGSDHSTLGGGSYNYIGAKYVFIGGGGGPIDGAPVLPFDDFTESAFISRPSISSLTSSMKPASRLDDYHSNTATGPWTTIGGGFDNFLADTLASTLGGIFNYAINGAFAASIGGGYGNWSMGGRFGSIGGGAYNTVSTGMYSTVGGGFRNLVSDTSSTIGGGNWNIIDDNYATISGGQLNEIESGANATIAGGQSNTIICSKYSVIGGGLSNTIDSNATYAGILSGNNNLNQGMGAVITGGEDDSILFTKQTYRSGPHCFIGSGTNNKIDGYGRDTAENEYAFNTAIVAGQNNTAREENSFIGAGRGNTINDGEAFIGSGDSNYINWGYSGIVTGSEDSIIAGYNSFIGAGESNKIDTSSFSAIGAGESNYINSTGSFIGAGDMDTILAVRSGIGTGYIDRIGPAGQNSYIGAGSYDSALANGSFIGAGNKNITDTGKGAGNFASIPGGQALKTQSYAQTALGFYNAPGGASTDPYSATSSANGDNWLVIVGNGLPDTGHTSRRSNAFTVSNNGHSDVYQTLGNLDSNGTGLPNRVPFYGGRYQDNTTAAWGHIPRDTIAGRNTNDTDNFGVEEVFRQGVGVYQITIQPKNPTNGSIVFYNHGSVVATAEDDSSPTGSGLGCIVVTCSKIVNNAFTIRTYSNCTAADEPFFFQVMGRP